MLTQIFLSTLSLRRATHQEWSGSQHAPDFYPRSPCGERLRHRLIELWKLRFLSTLSLRRATMTDGSICFDSSISIHALLAESDNFRCAVKCGIAYFYPRSPCGERRIIGIINNVVDNFYPRSPCGERPGRAETDKTSIGFLSTLSLRRAT